MKAIRRAGCGVFVAVLAASVQAQSVPEPAVSGEVVLATDTGVFVTAVGSPFRILKGARLLATPAVLATVSPDGRYLLVALAERLSSAARHSALTRPHFNPRAAPVASAPFYRSVEFNSPVVLHDVDTGRSTAIEDLSIRCATWAPDGHAFAFVSRDGMGVFDVPSNKAQILLPARQRRYGAASVSLGGALNEPLSAVMSDESTTITGRQECGPWVDNVSIAYRIFAGEFPRSLGHGFSGAADSGGIVAVGATATPIPFGDVAILAASAGGSTFIVAAAAEGEDTPAIHVARRSGATLIPGAQLPQSLEECRFTQHAGEVACVRRSGDGSARLTVVDTQSMAEVAGVDVPAFAGWLWIGGVPARQALVLQRDRDGRDVAALALADLGRGTIAELLDRSAIARVTGETAGLRLVGWLPSRTTE